MAALAPALERLPITRQSLLSILSLSERELRRAVGVGADRSADPRDSNVHTAHSLPVEICRHESSYPLALAQLDCAPAVLYATGTPERLASLLAPPTVAIIGDRNHTGYAHEITFALARDLASAGVTVISGLHQGVDGFAHHGALQAGGGTLAVVPCDPGRAYPRQLEHLHRRIVADGAAISEFPPGFFPPLRWCFIASQRIIAAVARMVVIVEAAERSSALLAAQIAAELGRDVAVVPGRVTDPGSHVTFALLRDGAQPVAGARDVLDLLKPSWHTSGRGLHR
jgi:DNA processing protein